MTTYADTVDITLPSDREVRVVRSFDAPRSLVFDAYTRPELVKRWLFGPDDWPIVDCTIDLRVGGTFRYVWRHAEKGEMAVSGTFLEIVSPERTVHTEIFDEDWTGGETQVTTEFSERDGRTTVSATVYYSSKEARDAALKTGMIEGWAQALSRLEPMLAVEAAE